MKTAIYYFSGTGNSLSIGSKLAHKLDCALIPMAAVMDKELDESYECIGLVYPTYMYRPPLIVVDFMKKLKSVKYLFIAVTNGGDSGDVLVHSQKHLNNNNVNLDASFSITMPSNYTPFGDAPTEEKQREIFEVADQQLEKIVKTVKNKDSFMGGRSTFFKEKIHPGILYAVGYWAIPFSDKSFWTSDQCVGCKSCMKTCPVNNIEMEDGKPKWNNNCQQCFACFHWCNKQAIEFKKVTMGKKRYRHPAIKRKQIIAQKTLEGKD